MDFLDVLADYEPSEPDLPEELPDEDIYSYITRILKEGRLPYTESNDLKLANLIQKIKKRKSLRILTKKLASDLDEINEKVLDSYEEVVEAYKKTTKKVIRQLLIKGMKKKYGLKVKDKKDLLPDQEFKKREMKYRGAMTKEWARLIAYRSKWKALEKLLIKQELKKQEKRKKKGIGYIETETDDRKIRISTLLDELDAKEEMVKTALFNVPRVSNTGLPFKDSLDEVVGRIGREAAKCRENIMKIMLEGGEAKKRRHLPVDYVDEQCHTCHAKEEEWERYRWTAKGVSYDEFTEKDAKEFHGRFVKSGGMQVLVDHFRNMFDGRVSPDVVFPSTIACITHADNSKKLYKTLTLHHYLSTIMGELIRDEENAKKNESFKYNIEGRKDAEEKKPCFMCENACEKCIKRYI